MNGLARSFQKRLDRDEEVIQSEKRTYEMKPRLSLCANPTRRRVFSLLCQFPCIHLRLLTRDLDVALSTLNWHLVELEQKQLLTAVPLPHRKVFYPTGYLTHEQVPLFTIIHGKTSGEIFNRIVLEPGIDQKGICKALNISRQLVYSHTRTLQDIGLIRIDSYGPLKNYTALDETVQKLTIDFNRKKDLKERLLKRLKADGLRPTVHKMTDDALAIEIFTGREREIFQIRFYRFVVGTTLRDDLTLSPGTREFKHDQDKHK